MNPIKEDGENAAVRAFLSLYGGMPGVRTDQMVVHMRESGFPVAPRWAEGQAVHLTKAGAQDWLRLLFALENNDDLQDAELLRLFTAYGNAMYSNDLNHAAALMERFKVALLQQKRTGAGQ